MKLLIIAMAVVIVVLLGVLFFYNPAHSPTVPVQVQNTSTSTTP